MSGSFAIILAAGEGKRLGAGIPKAMLEYEEGRSFLRQLASVFTKAGCRTLAIIGAEADKVASHHPTIRMLENERWEDGQFSSVRTGLRAALEEGAEQVVVHPVDMPFIRASTVSALLKNLKAEDAVVPAFEGAVGHPLVLSRAAAERVLAMQDVPSMEAALGALRVKQVAVKDPAVLLDVNTPEMHQRLFERPPRAAPPPKRRGKSAAVAATDEGASAGEG